MTVRMLDFSHRQHRASRPAERNGRTVVVPNDVLAKLHPHADRRGISVNALVREIVETAAEEGLIDAILDDEHRVVPQ